MTTTNKEPNIDEFEKAEKQKVARLHISEEDGDSAEFRRDVREHVKERLTVDEKTPTGATFIPHTGYWIDDDLEEHMEHGHIIEVWIDTQKELQAVVELKEDLEFFFDQYCVCLSMEEKTFMH